MKPKIILSDITFGDIIEVSVGGVETSNPCVFILAEDTRADGGAAYTPKNARKLARALLKAADKVDKLIAKGNKTP